MTTADSAVNLAEGRRVFSFGTVQRLACAAPVWAIVPSFDCRDVAARMQLVESHRLVELFSAKLLCRSTCLVGLLNSTRQQLSTMPHVPAAFLRPLEYLLELTEGGSFYRPCTPEDLAAGLPPPRWCLPLHMQLQQHTSTSGLQAQLQQQEYSNMQALALAALSSAPYWCLVHKYHEGVAKCDFNWTPRDLVAGLTSGSVSYFTLVLGLQMPKDRSLPWMKPCLFVPVAAILHQHQAGIPYVPVCINDLRMFNSLGFGGAMRFVLQHGKVPVIADDAAPGPASAKSAEEGSDAAVTDTESPAGHSSGLTALKSAMAAQRGGEGSGAADEGMRSRPAAYSGSAPLSSGTLASTGALGSASGDSTMAVSMAAAGTVRLPPSVKLRLQTLPASAGPSSSGTTSLRTSSSTSTLMHQVSGPLMEATMQQQHRLAGNAPATHGGAFTQPAEVLPSTRISSLRNTAPGGPPQRSPSNFGASTPASARPAAHVTNPGTLQGLAGFSLSPGAASLSSCSWSSPLFKLLLPANSLLGAPLQWWLLSDGQQCGPLSSEQMLVAYLMGYVHDSTLVCATSSNDSSGMLGAPPPVTGFRLMSTLLAQASQEGNMAPPVWHRPANVIPEMQDIPSALAVLLSSPQPQQLQLSDGSTLLLGALSSPGISTSGAADQAMFTLAPTQLLQPTQQHGLDLQAAAQALQLQLQHVQLNPATH